MKYGGQGSNTPRKNPLRERGFLRMRTPTKKRTGKTTVRDTTTKTFALSTETHSGVYRVTDETSTIGNSVHNVSLFAQEGRRRKCIFAKGLRAFLIDCTRVSESQSAKSRSAKANRLKPSDNGFFRHSRQSYPLPIIIL